MVHTTIPSTAELRELAAETARRCGVDLQAVAGEQPVTSPVNGGTIAELAWVDTAASGGLRGELTELGGGRDGGGRHGASPRFGGRAIRRC